MYLPPIDNAAVLNDIVLRMLSSGQARMVGKHTDTVADLELRYRVGIVRYDLAVFLRHSRNAKARFVLIKIKHVSVTAAGIEPDRSAVL